VKAVPFFLELKKGLCTVSSISRCFWRGIIWMWEWPT